MLRRILNISQYPCIIPLNMLIKQFGSRTENSSHLSMLTSAGMILGGFPPKKESQSFTQPALVNCRLVLLDWRVQ